MFIPIQVIYWDSRPSPTVFHYDVGFIHRIRILFKTNEANHDPSEPVLDCMLLRGIDMSRWGRHSKKGG